MAEDKEVIQGRMLSKISDEYDKTAGSFFYDALKPVAIELANLDAKAGIILNKGFADTAAGTDLERICSEQGIYRKLAVKSHGPATITGIAGAAITAGEMVASDNLNFVFTGDSVVPAGGSIVVEVECEKLGAIGNVPAGAIKYFPKTLEGLQGVSNAAAFTNGYDAESDESLRERYYMKIRTPATSGNKYHYLNWAKGVTGVGDARVFSLLSGPGTVGVMIINANKRAADSTLIDAVAAYIEDNRPIGAAVTVFTAAEKAIHINVSLMIDTGNYTVEQVQTSIEDNLAAYFRAIAFKEVYVSYARLGNIIFDTAGVLDYSGLQVNGGISNIDISDTEVAVLGGVILG